MSWYEEDTLEHIGFIEFGFNSTIEIEVYRDVKGNLYFCDHDDPEEPMDIEYVKQRVADCNDPQYDEQVAHAEQVCGMKLR